MSDEKDDKEKPCDNALSSPTIPSEPTRTHRRLGRLVLLVVEGPDRGKQHKIDISSGRVIKAGRSTANELVIHDELVSGTHFELLVEGQGVCLRDLNSRNGVYIHGTRVREALLDLEQVFRVGNTSIKLVGTATINAPMSDRDHFGQLYGDSPIMRELFADLERIAALAERLTVLITGETGTGKELVARGLHNASARAAGPFVVLDCTALPRDLAESQLLGHVQGAFTGAIRDQTGLFEQAHGGTLFIDELGELPLELQAKLLRPLEHGEIVRVGDSKVRKVDVRVIAATHRDLRLRMSQGKFREDLYFRLAYKVVQLPALRERGDDIVLLARRFVHAACTREGLVPKELSPAARAALLRGAWTGNVRQLKATVECAAMTTTSPMIEPTDLRVDEPGESPSRDLNLSWTLRLPVAQAKEEFEKVYYRDILGRVGGGRGWTVRGAKLAGLDRTGFIKALKRLGLFPEQYSEPED
jgi:DNA-binding NtrC family response regulator